MNSHGQHNGPGAMMGIWVTFIAAILIVTILLIVGLSYQSEAPTGAVGQNECSDQRDNEGDGFTDFPKDADCENVFDNSEGNTPGTETTCGNNQCDPDENFADCPTDCACGDGVCEGNEDAANCTRDCYCGNGQCEENETVDSCYEDCAPTD